MREPSEKTEQADVITVLNRLHEQGVINLDIPLRKMLEDIGPHDLALILGHLARNDHYCIVVRNDQ